MSSRTSAMSPRSRRNSASRGESTSIGVPLHVRAASARLVGLGRWAISATRISGPNFGVARRARGLRSGYGPVAKSLVDLRDRLTVGVQHLRGQRRKLQLGAELLAGADRVGEEVPQRLRLA